MKKKITIVGAGISGLYLAYLLEDLFEVTVLEARERIGGRVFSIKGHDMGPSWVWSHQTKMLALIQKFGLELFTQYTQGYALYDTKNGVEKFNPPPSAPSARVHGSLTALINALHKSLKSTKLLLSHEVQSIHQVDQKVTTKTLNKSFESDFVIVTLPPRLALALDFIPTLPKTLYTKMMTTPTWMGHTAKCVIEFTKPFWQENSLSGFVFSHVGPLGEMHDASTQTKHALFGFVSSNANMQSFHKDLKLQLKRLFNIGEKEIIAIHLVDWREEKYTAHSDDKKPLREHPLYGIDTNDYTQSILFSATEFSSKEGGYLEGALQQTEQIAQKIKLINMN